MEKTLNEFSLLWNQVGPFSNVSKLVPSGEEAGGDFSLINLDSEHPIKSNYSEVILLNDVNATVSKWNSLLNVVKENETKLKLHEKTISNLSELTLKEILLHNNFKHINRNYSNLLSTKQLLNSKITRMELIYAHYNNYKDFEGAIKRAVSSNDLSLTELVELIILVKINFNFFETHKNYFRADFYRNKYSEQFKFLLQHFKQFLKLHVFSPSCPKTAQFTHFNKDQSKDSNNDHSTKLNKDEDELRVINKLLINMNDDCDELLQIRLYYLNFRIRLIDRYFDNLSFFNNNNNNIKDNNKDNKDNDNNNNSKDSEGEGDWGSLGEAAESFLDLIAGENALYATLFENVPYILANNSDGIAVIMSALSSHIVAFLKAAQNRLKNGPQQSHRWKFLLLQFQRVKNELKRASPELSLGGFEGVIRDLEASLMKNILSLSLSVAELDVYPFKTAKAENGGWKRDYLIFYVHHVENALKNFDVFSNSGTKRKFYKSLFANLKKVLNEFSSHFFKRLKLQRTLADLNTQLFLFLNYDHLLFSVSRLNRTCKIYNFSNNNSNSNMDSNNNNKDNNNNNSNNNDNSNDNNNSNNYNNNNNNNDYKDSGTGGDSLSNWEETGNEDMRDELREELRVVVRERDNAKLSLIKLLVNYLNKFAREADRNAVLSTLRKFHLHTKLIRNNSLNNNFTNNFNNDNNFNNNDNFSNNSNNDNNFNKTSEEISTTKDDNLYYSLSNNFNEGGEASETTDEQLDKEENSYYRQEWDNSVRKILTPLLQHLNEVHGLNLSLEEVASLEPEAEPLPPQGENHLLIF